MSLRVCVCARAGGRAGVGVGVGLCMCVCAFVCLLPNAYVQMIAKLGVELYRGLQVSAMLGSQTFNFTQPSPSSLAETRVPQGKTKLANCRQAQR